MNRDRRLRPAGQASRWFRGLPVLVVLALLGCEYESRRRVLTFLFEDIAADGTYASAAVARSPRHPPAATPIPTPTPFVQVKPKVDVTSWEAAQKDLPKDIDGNPDFVAAMATDLIAPRAGTDPQATPAETQELELVLESKKSPALKVPFSHRVHTQWLQCPNCHTDLFEMTAGAAHITMADIDAGKYCGACHGPVVFGGPKACGRCHLDHLPRDTEGNLNWTKALGDKLIAPLAGRDAKAQPKEVLPLDLELLSPTRPDMKVKFSHEAHTEWLACDNCHPKIFEMASGAAKMTMDDLNGGRYCGVCHGPVAFGIAEGCQRCHLGHLPTDAAGRPDWQRALAEKVVNPRVSREPGGEGQPVFPLELELAPRSQTERRTPFSHQAHTAWLACPNCHERIFRRKAGSTKMTMEDLSAGRFCGECHGTVAFGNDACARCHPPAGGPR